MPEINNKKSSDIEKVSTKLTPTIRVIIPAKFKNQGIERNYFNPRFIKLVKEGIVQWINQDDTSHNLVFYNVSNKVELLYDNATIKPDSELSLKFAPLSASRIDYSCLLHPNENGTVVIYPVPESEMSNTDQLRFLDKIFDINPTSTLSHLRSG